MNKTSVDHRIFTDIPWEHHDRPLTLLHNRTTTTPERVFVTVQFGCWALPLGYIMQRRAPASSPRTETASTPIRECWCAWPNEGGVIAERYADLPLSPRFPTKEAAAWACAAAALPLLATRCPTCAGE